MQEHRFNFVRRKSAVKFSFVARETRVAAGRGRSLPRGFASAARGFVLSAIVLGVFIFSANLLIHSLMAKLDFKNFNFDISPMAKPKYFISKGNMYTVFSNGRTELVDRNMDNVSMPFITGVEIDEKRPAQKKALAMAAALDQKYLSNVSEINLSNPDNIIIITVEGRRLYAGDLLSDEKLENYHIALDRITRNFSTADLRYKDRVIIK